MRLRFILAVSALGAVLMFAAGFNEPDQGEQTNVAACNGCTFDG